MSLEERLMEQLNCDRDAAKFLLEASNNDFNVAINLHFDSLYGSQANSSPGVHWDPSDDSNVRAPIPRKFDVLCPSENLSRRGRLLNASEKTTNTVLFRDFEQETRNQEAMMGIGQSVFSKQQAGSSSAGTSRKSRDLAATTIAHRRKLEELFRPPLDLIYKGSFFMAREHGWDKGLWLLVNIQKDEDFSCHVLNRDIWTNSNVRKLLQGFFMLWQVAHNSEHGKKFLQFYTVTKYPFIGIIDSSTGELMDSFSETDPQQFCLFLKGFVNGHGKLPRRKSGDKVKLVEESGSDSGEVVGSAAMEDDELRSRLLDKRKSYEDSTCSSPELKRVRAIEQDGDISVTRKSETLLDITEEDQMKLAIAESLKLSQSSPIRRRDEVENDDSDASFLAFSDEEEEENEKQEINYSFEEVLERNDQTKQTVDKQYDDRPTTSGKLSQWKVAKSCLSSGSIADRVASNKAVDSSSQSMRDCSAESNNDAVDHIWKRLTEGCTGEEHTLQIKLPDGVRHTLQLPADAPLQVLHEYLRTRDVMTPQYHAMCGYPRQDLLVLPVNTTLQEAGVARRDALFVERV